MEPDLDENANAPAAGGPRSVAPFSRAVEADGWVFVTGLGYGARIERDLVARRPVWV